MSQEIVTNVLKHSAMKSTKRLLLVILGNEANTLGVAHSTIETLAQLAHIDARRVSAHINGIEAAGEIFVYRRDGLQNVYIVLPGLDEDKLAQAVNFINGQIRSKQRQDALIKMADLPPTVPSGVTPDSSVTPDDSIGGSEPLTIPSGVPPTVPSGGGDSSVRGYKDLVVVVQNQESDQPIQQQQGQTREPCDVEKQLFSELLISETIWRAWMTSSPIDVVAAYLHVTHSDGIDNPLGLMRAMIERGTGRPKRKFVERAKQAIERGALEEMIEEFDPTMQNLLADAKSAGFDTVEAFLSERSWQQFVGSQQTATA